MQSPRDKNGKEIRIGDRVRMPLGWCHFGEAVVISTYPDMVWAKDDHGQSFSAAACQVEVLKSSSNAPPS